jgi:hypothetical protein
MTRGHTTAICRVCRHEIPNVPARRTICDKCETPKQAARRAQMREYHKNYRRVTPRLTSEGNMPIAQRLEESVHRHRVPMCMACNNLPHARPKTGCPPRTVSARGKLMTCGLPYSDEEAIKPHVGGYSLIAVAQRYA